MKTDITLLSASAGSGKTYSLTERLVEALSLGTRPDGIVGTTFTKKAASELISRVRTKLIEDGRSEAAQRVFDGYIGTVNSVCGAILKDYAFEAGLSPTLDVLPEGRDSAVFSIAVAQVVGNYAPRIRPMMFSFAAFDWEDQVRDILDKARANGLDRAMLLESARRSWESMKSVLPSPITAQEGEDLDKELLAELDRAINSLPASGDTTKGTVSVKNDLLALRRTVRNGRLSKWSDWVSLINASPTNASAHVMESLHELAGQVLAHPRLHEDLENYIHALFECAADALGRFQQYKKDLGLIDFTDQEVLALGLLKRGTVRERLKERLDLLLVDEFQDTSPVQLALFLQLAEVAGKSIWVGDQKQSIYGFRGTDPKLMDGVIRSLKEIDKENVKILEDSWRSQPELVGFTNAFFSAALSPHGFDAGQVRLNPKVDPTSPPDGHLACWRLDAKNKDMEAAAVAKGIRSILKRSVEHPVLDKHTKSERPLKSGDIAVLCRKNDDCTKVASALEAAGIRAAIPRPGLMSCHETVLSLAALRYMLDETDLLAIAEMARLIGPDGEETFDPAWWLEKARYKNLDALKSRIASFERLDEARAKLVQLTAAEMLDLAMELVGVRHLAASWGNEMQRLANLDALRGYAGEYEDLCDAARTPCTPTGLLLHLKELAANNEDKQAEGMDDEAVQVLTYHRSKGLEWPLVVMTGLESVDKPRIFGLTVVSPADFRLDSPLADRWLRFWPWPFGSKRKFDAFTEAVDASTHASDACEHERQERLRLLYVGMTRARDYLVFAARALPNSGKSTTAWLDACVDDSGEQVMELPTSEGMIDISVGNETCKFASKVISPLDATVQSPSEAIYMPQRAKAGATHPRRHFPMGAEAAEGKVSVELIPLDHGEPESITRGDDLVRLGELVHAFFAAVPWDMEDEQRLQRAKELLADWQIKELSPEQLMAMHDRQREYVDRTWPEAEIIHEWPVHLKKGLQEGSGWIDMLLRLPEGDVIIDHKTFAGNKAALEKKASSYAGQLQAYAHALSKAFGRPVLGTFIHFPLAGMLVKVDISDR